MHITFHAKVYANVYNILNDNDKLQLIQYMYIYIYLYLSVNIITCFLNYIIYIKNIHIITYSKKVHIIYLKHLC